MIDDVIHVQTCGNVGISFICADNTVSVFTRDNQAGYGGNSTDCKIVDLNDEPLRWIR